MESLVHQLDTVKHFPRGFRNTTPSFSTSELPLHLFYMSMLAHIRPFRYGTGSPPRFISVCFQQFLLSACPFFFYHLRALSLSLSLVYVIVHLSRIGLHGPVCRIIPEAFYRRTRFPGSWKMQISMNLAIPAPDGAHYNVFEELCISFVLFRTSRVESSSFLKSCPTTIFPCSLEQEQNVHLFRLIFHSPSKARSQEIFFR